MELFKNEPNLKKGDKSIKITQSLIKSLYEVKIGQECGLVFEAKFIEGKFDLFPPTETMNLGTYFEYLATGALPKNGKIPQPTTYKSDDSKLKANYEKTKKHVQNYKLLLLNYGLKVIKAGYDMEFSFIKGTIDVLCEATKDIFSYDYITKEKKVIAKKGDLIIVDLKYTGLIDDKWSDIGWNLERLSDKNKIVLQPIHYLFIAKQLYPDRNVLFLFFLFNSANENDYRVIDFKIKDEDYKFHLELIMQTVKLLEKYIKNGFPPHPSYVKCIECPLKKGCSHFKSIPEITSYTYQREI